MSLRILLFHGRDKHPSDAWYPWFSQKCEEYKIECAIPQMPLVNPPVLNEWLKIIDDLKPDKNTVLVGHSRGGMAILRWLEQAPPELKIKKVVLVAANNPNFPDQVMGDFYGSQYDFEKIKQHCDSFFSFTQKMMTTSHLNLGN